MDKRKHSKKHIRISLYVEEELYEEFMTWVTLSPNNASWFFEKEMRRWLIDNEDWIAERQEERVQFPRGMS